MGGLRSIIIQIQSLLIVVNQFLNLLQCFHINANFVAMDSLKFQV